MEVSLTTAQRITPLSFIFCFAAQIYGLLSTPNMKDVNDANLSFWSPAPAMVGIFFFSLQAVQVAWLYQLFKLDTFKSETDSRVVLSYVPYCVIGNLSIGIWVFFWNASALKLANLFVCVNTMAQLYYAIIKVERMNLSSRASVFTHLVSKMFAGISVIDVLHNTSIAYCKDEKAGTLIRVLTPLIFGTAAVTGDWIFGFCLVYDLTAIAVGQNALGNAGWAKLLWIYAGVTAGVVLLKNMLKPPYERKDATYSEVPAQEE